MLTHEMKRTLEKQRLGFVATVSEDGYPNLSPKGTFVVIDDETIAFGEIRSPGTIANLRSRPVIEVNIVDPFSRKGFRAKGVATVSARDSDTYRSHRALFDHWGALAARIDSIIVIQLISVELLSSPAYDDGATETDLRKQWVAILLAND